ncbi:MAG TPA: 2-amino-4-hydroxy-6-hydroxymethyldihydropteridine diphosphokinase [Oscillatoriales cyanobacterium M59_W2019_021]|nr:MAG: 2-amino-4-hydroxy-6-hydroxymethyldihydropteridine diphosphokinase [Cyanobacteria bacterium J055]HIK32758.1 2-amino-4-hydroxy-6-hydroxymethyldihydropteridine diphosphokinase [Oscillatoriales cyanobacterium M4454_W2019_049]HIK49821.1 2-amino-4-hydroxy-6-hydroxymethyldihydropteridine diphosphokinase [Oscillatoriales cyanobacterium M59_W2019_021]
MPDLEPVPVAIALGSNLGDSLAILDASLGRLNETPGWKLLRRSHWYRTAPVGPPQPDYLNGCALFRVDRSPFAVLDLLLQTEREFGRVRRQRWGPRTLDLDLLWFDGIVLDTPTLTLPHPRLRERAFVLVPLAEIAPDWIDPISGKSIDRLLQEVDYSGVEPLESTEVEQLE